MELFRQFRPETYDDVVGQDNAISVLKTKIESKSLPHTLLLAGSPGTGKTSIARIIARDLDCIGCNLTEINCAEVRGIDSVREIQEEMRSMPMGGSTRIWIFDEVVQWPKATQQALLKTLEEPPPHVYFILCTSDTAGLLPSLMSRCFQLHLKTLNSQSLTTIVKSVLNQLQPRPEVSEKVFTALISKSDNNARKALQLLEAVVPFVDEDRQLQMLGLSDASVGQKIEFLALALMRKDPWDKVVRILESVEEPNVETIRRQVLDFCAKVMVSKAMGFGDNPIANRARAYTIIQVMRESYLGTGRAGLIADVYQVIQATQKK